MKRILLNSFFLCFLFLLPSPVITASPFGGSKHSELVLLPIKISALTNKTFISKGEEFKLHLSILVKEGWHIYSLNPFQGRESLATQILMDKNNFQEQSEWKGPDPVLIKDGALDKIVKGYRGRIEFSKTYIVPIGVVPQIYSLTGNIALRACDDQICTLPRKFPFHTEIKVRAY